MHPRIQEVVTYLDSRRDALESAVAAIPPELRDRRPAPDRWSAAEVLEHLALAEGMIAKLVAGLVRTAREAGLGAETDTSPIVPTVDVDRLLDRGRAVVASEASLPRAGLDASAAMGALVRAREALRGTILAADGLALGEVEADNRVLGRLNVYQWVVFVAGHEARHTAQIREIAAALPAHLPDLPTS